MKKTFLFSTLFILGMMMGHAQMEVRVQVSPTQYDSLKIESYT